MEERNDLLNTQLSISEVEDEMLLRPQYLEHYIGQEKVRKQMNIFIKAARKRKETLDHTLIFGPPGLGKTTLANIIANEMQGRLVTVSGPTLEKAGDIATMLTTLEEGDVLFIDEIHRVKTQIEEILYSAMEDQVIDILIGEGTSSKSIQIPLPSFTLVGATTRAGMLSAPLRDRFGITQRLEFYKANDLTEIVKRSARVQNSEIDEISAKEIASRSRGTPRIANRLLRRVKDLADIETSGIITLESTQKMLNLLDIDPQGLDDLDRKIIEIIRDNYNGGPVGINTLAASVGEEKDIIEDVVEPYLIQQGILIKTPRGRKLSDNYCDKL